MFSGRSVLAARATKAWRVRCEQMPGAIGYVELAYARQNKLPYAAIKNAAGKFVLPTIESITAAAAGAAAELPATTDFRVSHRQRARAKVRIRSRRSRTSCSTDAARRREGQEARRFPEVGDS